jgi:LPXTG-site transpeptidase (sortase) family protein
MFAKSNNEASIQKDLESGVVHYANTALPGEAGNSVIFGHSSNDWWEPGNYKFVFVLLDKLAVGDTFSVNYNSKQYIYKVSETKVVLPTDLSVLNSTTDPEMTLITCTPPGTSWKRLIVKAKQISPDPSVVNSKSSLSSSSDNQGTLPGNSPSLTDQLSKWWHSFTGLFGHDSSGNGNATPPSSLPDAR